MKKLPSLDDINKYVSYDPETGLFYRKKPSVSGSVGDSISQKNNHGYGIIYINGLYYMAHRIAWKIVFKEPGKMQIDHINHIRNDNRIENLRLVTAKENQKNISISKRSKTGFVGVLWRESAKSFRSHIMIDNKEIHLEYSKTLIDAVIKRMKANEKYGFHKNHGML